MNYLQLSQALARECGISGTQAALVPATVANQFGELGRIVGWINDAWREIQGHHLYDWMWENPTLTVLAGNSTLAQSVAANRYLTESACRPVAGTDGDWLEFMFWSEWRRTYSSVYIAGNLTPTVWTIRPDNALVLNATVAANTAISLERYANPTTLLADDDVPGMPADLHMLIVYKAIVRYANFDEAGVRRKTAQAEVIRMESDLAVRCLPKYRIGGPITDD